ncbi:MAG: tRNA (adenosine(37)-N6)-threonylcarbamoyltransferase complex dimerization subunit type 1 TsaB [Actinomycetes bacterium]|nr:MAG: tRNA (adenosine(37)-N6)-threonylcarbamoyltransferase complex dimerization subunit type 1 TsaB [Actinomycetes bacterium]
MILGFDTATGITAVAVADRGAVVSEEWAGPGPDGRPAAARELLGMIDAAVRGAGGWERIRTVAVGRGPGSFTGLRIAISTARALSQARRIPVVGIDTTAALAAGIAVDRVAAGGARVGVVDARRGEVFAAADRGEGAGEPVVCRPRELAEALGGGLAGATAAGDGAVRFRSEIEAAGFAVPVDEDPANRLSAARICGLAAKMGRGEARFPAVVTPKYMRRPDAERWRERDHRS